MNLTIVVTILLFLLGILLTIIGFFLRKVSDKLDALITIVTEQQIHGAVMEEKIKEHISSDEKYQMKIDKNVEKIFDRIQIQKN